MRVVMGSHVGYIQSRIWHPRDTQASAVVQEHKKDLEEVVQTELLILNNCELL